MSINAISSSLPLMNPIKDELNIEAPKASVGSWLGHQLQDTNTKLNEASTALHNLASGNADSLHHTMLALSEAKLSLQFLEQIRNRVMSAYQEILREQI